MSNPSPLERTPPARELLAFAHALADLSGPVVLKQFRRAHTVTDKGGAGGFDPVTAADRNAERVIRRAIARRWPGHGVLGEEYGDEGRGGRFTWVIDPIDGTRAFITGSPLWGTLVGLLDGDRPHLGVMDQPFTRERFWSGETASYWRMGEGKARRLATRACTRLGDAFLAATHPDLFAPGLEAEGFARLKSGVRMTRFGGDCYSYCQLAAGCVDIVTDCGMKAFDIVALIPIIERAGGCVTTWDGGPAAGGGRILATGNAKLHEAALKVLRPGAGGGKAARP